MNPTISLLLLVDICKQVDGRKKLQKIVHILKEAGHQFDFRFGFHFHGPFSAELKGEIDSLVSEKLIQEEETKSPSGEYRQFTYSPAPDLHEVLDRFGSSSKPAWEDLAIKLNKMSATELESISTMAYLIRLGTPELDLAKRFQELKPHLVRHSAMATKFATEVTIRSSHGPHSPA